MPVYPQRIQNYDDPISQFMMPPPPPGRNPAKPSEGTLPSTPRPLPLHQKHGEVQRVSLRGIDGPHGRAPPPPLLPRQ